MAALLFFLARSLGPQICQDWDRRPRDPPAHRILGDPVARHSEMANKLSHRVISDVPVQGQQLVACLAFQLRGIPIGGIVFMSKTGAKESSEQGFAGLLFLS